ncbi:MAG TPA: glycosyltransferase [Candidatus Hydromicrobium sp.]
MTLDNKRKVLPNVSFITTVYNEEKNIIEFLKSLMEQAFLPGEIIIVDGESKDHTFSSTLSFFRDEVSRKRSNLKMVLIDGGTKNKMKNDKKNSKPVINIRIIKKSGANISQGRNAAIKSASGGIICVSDAGCILDRNWLGEITRFYDDTSCNIVGGLNLPFCRNFVQKCLAVCIMPLKEEINTERYMPSSRNISFKKKTWFDIGGYPKDMDYGEDMKFNFNVKAAGYRIRFNPGAIVYWKMRENPVQISRQFFRYAKGDARGGMYLYRHVVRFFSFIIFITILLCAFYLSKWILLILVPLFIAYIYKPYSRLIKAWRSNGNCGFYGMEKLLSISTFFIPLLLLQIDFSKMCGYIYGLLKKRPL